MFYPPDILISPNAKYHGFVDSKLSYNSHWDITWSFTFALTGTEHAFCTFLTTNPSPLSGLPGQYLGYLGNTHYLTDEIGNILTDENGEFIVIDIPYYITPNWSDEFNNIIKDENGNSTITYILSTAPQNLIYENTGVIAVAFDSTGYFALSTDINPGVGLNGVIKNSLIIRDTSNNIVCNVALSSLDTAFSLSSATKKFQTLRFRLGNAGKRIYVDYKTENTMYKSLTAININLNPLTHPILYPGFTFCSPISSSSIVPSTMFLKNFHTQGNTAEPTYEYTTMIPLTSTIKTTFTTISGVSARHL